MEPLVIYYLKVNIAMALFYTFYRLFFRNDTFFGLRRITLLSIYFIAFLYPLADLSMWFTERQNFTELIQLYTTTVLPEVSTVAITHAAPQLVSFNWQAIGLKIIASVYIAGLLVFTYRCIAELINITLLFFRSKKRWIGDVKVCILPQKEEPFSFMGWIFIHPATYREQVRNEILQHENAHVKQWHSLDMILGELVLIFCWINPFAWLLKREIGINHEYLADQQVIRAGFNKKEYQYSLIGMEHILPGAAANLYNHFSVLPLKKRIIMLNKRKTQRIGQLKYLMFIPLAGLLLIFSNVDAMARVTGYAIEPISLPSVIEKITVPAEPQSKAVADTDTTVYTVVEKSPRFADGGDAGLLKYINTNVKYPSKAVEEKQQGRVSVKFIVEKDGSLSNFQIPKDRGAGPLLDAEALRVMKSMPNWIPGEQRGKKVRVSFVVPVMFKLGADTSTQSVKTVPNQTAKPAVK